MGSRFTLSVQSPLHYMELVHIVDPESETQVGFMGQIYKPSLSPNSKEVLSILLYS